MTIANGGDGYRPGLVDLANGQISREIFVSDAIYRLGDGPDRGQVERAQPPQPVPPLGAFHGGGGLEPAYPMTPDHRCLFGGASV